MRLKQMVAAAGSALTSHDSSGSRVYYISSDNPVHELAWMGSNWNNTYLTSATSAPPAITGSAVHSHYTSHGPAGGGSRVYFISSDNNVHELVWVGDTWITGDLTSATNAPPAIAGSALASHDTSVGPAGGGSRVHFISSDNHVHELAWTGTAWNTTDLSSLILPSNWMGQVDGSRYLSQLSIPATHDSLTYDATVAAQDQNIDIGARRLLDHKLRPNRERSS
jgi:fucose-binding lectin